ncbi:hypothetical protein [Castellaniella sp.]|nr:hypothetical protein [Castellaniella sp.]
MTLLIGRFELDLHIGGLYLKVPRLFELAWNGNGFYCNRAAA